MTETTEETTSRNARTIAMIDQSWIEEDAQHEAEFERLRTDNARLLAEVERLRTEIEQQRAALATPEGYRGVVSEQLADEVERLRAERRGLWRFVEPVEGALLVYCAVHTIQWRSEWGEPAAGFVQAE